MCTEARILKDGGAIACETMGQLADALGLELDAVPKFGEFTAQADDCLCNVRWDKLSARPATHEEGWPFPEYIIE